MTYGSRVSMQVKIAAALVVWTILASPAGLFGAAPPKPVAPVMWVELDGVAKPFENGGRVTVGAIVVEIFMAPFPPLREGSIDLYLTEKGTGRPVSGNTLRILFDMDMPHGSIRAEALPTGGGHFLVPYKLVMPGQWRIDITIAKDSSLAEFALIFKVE